jgi:hypothetical protein
VTSAAEVVRDAIIAGLKAEAAFDGVAGLGVEPGAGSLPQVEVAWPLASDWGTKTETGRELRTFVTVRVAKGQRGRLPGLVDAVERVGAGLVGAIDGWRVASAVFVRTRFADGRDETRVAQVEHRVRVLEG